MSRSTSDFLTKEDRSRGTRFACQHCCHRNDCPYFCDRVFEKFLCRATSRGQSAAQLLTAEAERFLEKISCADNTSRLLRADEALERRISDILCAEIDLMKSLSLM